MNLSKEDFIKIFKEKIPFGMEVDLEKNHCFVYFEMIPYSKNEVIKFNVCKIKHDDEGILLYCDTRYKEFYTGHSWIETQLFLRYAKNIRFHDYAECPKWLIPNLNNLKID